MCTYDIEAYNKVTYDIIATFYCYYYPSMQLFMLCKCVFYRNNFHTNATFMSLVFMYNSNMSSKWAGPFKCLIAEITFRTMSGSNECDKLEKNVIISLIIMCNTVTIPYSYLLHYLMYIF